MHNQSMFKKIIRKVSVKSSAEKRPLVNAYNENCFFVVNGPVLSNLSDLQRAFTYMADAQFAHHVSKKRNDFADWVELVLLDRDCARSLRGAFSVKESVTAVEKHLKEYHLR